jgi:ABC-type bacteriocin/lantibiotic exporter with double-glycine peptidase domain
MSRNCGVECICFLAKLYDSNISTDQIRQISKKYLANNEINLPGLKKLCNKVGLGQWETVQMDLCDIDYVIKPFILHFKQDHFVLCTDVSDNLIQILDPTGGSTKIKTMPKSVFGKFFDGYSLIRVTESKERL